MNIIDKFLNQITTYRLVLYGLCAIALVAGVLSIFGILSFSLLSLLASLGVLLFAGFFTNLIFARIYRAHKSTDSVWITSLILFLTLAPPANLAEALMIAGAAMIANASKYIFALKKKHIFNPAAFALAALSLLGSGLSVWWVGTVALLPIVAIVGLLTVRKIRRFDLFWSFVITSVLLSYLLNLSLITFFNGLLLSGPLVFFSTIMLTEPLTMPPSRPLRIIFGIVVGILFTTPWAYGTPQVSLLLGNIYAYLVGSKQKLMLRLKSVEQLASNVYEFAFVSKTVPQFVSGQYLEWTLPHSPSDSRGNRRYFTIASAPGDKDVRFGVRIDANHSSFKDALLKLKEGAEMSATSLAGDFILPKEIDKKLVFIAGGIGITPFISMFRTMLKTGERRNIVLFLATQTRDDVAYAELLQEVYEKFGILIIHIYGTQRITRDLLNSKVPDYKDRLFYLSGPDAMVQSYRQLLRGAGVGMGKIHTDYFPGF